MGNSKLSGRRRRRSSGGGGESTRSIHQRLAIAQLALATLDVKAPRRDQVVPEAKKVLHEAKLLKYEVEREQLVKDIKRLIEKI